MNTRTLPRILLAAALTLLAACGRSTEGGIEGLGTLEVVEIDVAPMLPGRVLRVWVEEGDQVRAGDTLVALTQATLSAEIEGHRARLAAAEAQLRDLEAGARPAELQRAQAEVRVAEAEAARAARELERLTALAAEGHVTEQQLDAARSAASSGAARLDAAREALRLLREGTRPERIRGGRAEVASARAALEAAERTASDLVLTASADGQVLARHVEPGEILTAGEAALTLGQVARPWVRVYLNPQALPLIQVGDPVTATLDGFPDRPFTGRVVAISRRAEFTPRVALTESERADLLFGVRVEFDDTSGMLQAGLPVTVRFTEATARAARERERLAQQPSGNRP